MQARPLVLICTTVVVFCAGVLRPVYNWDIIGYVASAYHEDGYRGAELNRRTYDDILTEAGPQTLEDLTQGPYGGTVYRSPESLAQHLPFYSIRVVYVELVRLTRSICPTYARATYVVSATFGALSVLMLGAMFTVAGIPAIALPLVVAASGYGHLASLSTPDALATFFSLLAMYCLLTRRSLLFVVSAILPCMRTDAVVLSALLMAYAFLRGQRLAAVLSFAVSAAAYLLINRLQGNYGWLTLFNFALIKISPYPAQMVLSHRWTDYVWGYFATFRDVLMDENFLLPIVALGLYAIARLRRGLASFPAFPVFFGIPLCLIALRFALFPSFESRFFVFPASLILAGTLGVIDRETRPAGGS